MNRRISYNKVERKLDGDEVNLLMVLKKSLETLIKVRRKLDDEINAINQKMSEVRKEIDALEYEYIQRVYTPTERVMSTRIDCKPGRREAA